MVEVDFKINTMLFLDDIDTSSEKKNYGSIGADCFS